nr:hypothetical protein GCM10020093_043000 [Planobispora longispora]
MPPLNRPDVDTLHNLSASIIVDQERMGANARSTVGTATDTYTMLRIVFSRIGVPHAARPSPSASTPRRACARAARASARSPTSTPTSWSTASCP